MTKAPLMLAMARIKSAVARTASSLRRLLCSLAAQPPGRAGHLARQRAAAGAQRPGEGLSPLLLRAMRRRRRQAASGQGHQRRSAVQPSSRAWASARSRARAACRRHRGGPGEGRLAGQDLAEDRPEAEHVAMRRSSSPGRLLRRPCTRACRAPTPVRDGCRVAAGAGRCGSRSHGRRLGGRRLVGGSRSPSSGPWRGPSPSPAPRRSPPTMTFDGFRSRWITPWAWAYADRLADLLEDGEAPAGSTGGAGREERSARVRPLISFMARNGRPSAGGRARGPAGMPGCWSWPVICASSTKRAVPRRPGGVPVAAP